LIPRINESVFLQPIDYDGFLQFMEYYLEADLPTDLSHNLFLSFMRRPIVKSLGKDYTVKDIAMATSQTLCAPVVHQATEPPDIPMTPKEKHATLADKLHGLTEKIQSLGGGAHSRTDSLDGGAKARSRAG
jgi:hypothetical protein